MSKYNVSFVYQSLSDEQKKEIIDFWLENKALPDKSVAEKRVGQVCCVIRDGEDNLVGLSTAFLRDFTAPNNPYFFCRIFIKKENRDEYNLRKSVFQTMYKELKALSAGKAFGLAVVLENISLQKLSASTAFFKKRGYTYHGKSAQGLPMWYIRFDEPKGIFEGL